MNKSKWRRWILGSMIFTGSYYSLLIYDKITQGDGRLFRLIAGGILIGSFIWYSCLCGDKE